MTAIPDSTPTEKATGDRWRLELRDRLAEVPDGDELRRLSRYCSKRSKERSDDADSDPEARLAAVTWWLGTAALEERAWRQVSLAEMSAMELDRLSIELHPLSIEAAMHRGLTE